MKTNRKPHKILSLMMALAMIFSIIPPVTVSVADTYDGYELIKVWEPDLTGATVKDSGQSNRNYVLDKEQKGLGLITSSSGVNQITVQNNTLKFTNGGTDRRLNIVAAGTGTGGSSAKGAGFDPKDGQLYHLEVRAQNQNQNGAGNIQFYDYANTPTKKPAVLKSGTTDVFEYDFIYRESERTDSSAKDGTHGINAVGIVVVGSSNTTVYFSDLRIFEMQKLPPQPCKFCKEIICICEYQVVSQWDFTTANYPTAPIGNTTNATAETPSTKEIKASGGANVGKDSIVRNHHQKYPDKSFKSGLFDNTNSMKHMALKGTSAADSGWLMTSGWSNAENYVYLKLDTRGYDKLILKYDIRATNGSSSPGELKLQYRFDPNGNWKNVPGGDVSTRGPGGKTDVVIPREEHLPPETYNKSEVYIRWFGQSGSTSGIIEFRNIEVVKSDAADPLPSEESDFTHINLAPGKDPTEIGFAWFTPKDYTKNTPKIQYAKASELTNGGEMPSSSAALNAAYTVTASSVYNTNKITLTNLAKNTEYAYRVGDGTNWSPVYRFKTQDPDSAYDVMVVADPQINGSASNWRQTMNYAIGDNSDYAFILSAGDQMERTNNPNLADMYVSPPELRSYPLASAYGNHDHTFAEDYKDDVRYLPLMYSWPNTMPVSGDTSDGHLNDGHDYYFSYGDTLYIILDSNIRTASKHNGSMQKAIASHPNAKWKICVFHHDIYGGGKHADGDTVTKMRADWSALMTQHGIDLAFNGHDHIYVRSKFFNNNQSQNDSQQKPAFLGNSVTQANPGVFVDPKGTQYLALGTPGDKYYPLEGNPNWIAYTAASTERPEYTKMRVESDSLIVETFRCTVTGDRYELTDSITLRKKARREDLATVLSCAQTLIDSGSISSGSANFQSAVNNAKAVLNNNSSSADQIHDAYTAVYTAYNNLNNNISHKPVTGVSLNKTALSLSTGEDEENTATLTATVTPSNATNKAVIWTSSNPAAATVSADGVVTAIGEGTAIITARTANGSKVASCTVAVTIPIPITTETTVVTTATTPETTTTTTKATTTVPDTTTTKATTTVPDTTTTPKATTTVPDTTTTPKATTTVPDTTTTPKATTTVPNSTTTPKATTTVPDTTTTPKATTTVPDTTTTPKATTTVPNTTTTPKATTTVPNTTTTPKATTTVPDTTTTPKATTTVPDTTTTPKATTTVPDTTTTPKATTTVPDTTTTPKVTTTVPNTTTTPKATTTVPDTTTTPKATTTVPDTTTTPKATTTVPDTTTTPKATTTVPDTTTAPKTTTTVPDTTTTPKATTTVPDTTTTPKATTTVPNTTTTPKATTTVPDTTTTPKATTTVPDNTTTTPKATTTVPNTTTTPKATTTVPDTTTTPKATTTTVPNTTTTSKATTTVPNTTTTPKATTTVPDTTTTPKATTTVPDTTTTPKATTTVPDTTTTTPTTTTAPSVTTESETTATTPREPEFKLGRIISFDEEPSIFDALEILKCLVNMDSKANGNPAALITKESQEKGEPSIFDALEVLKKLVNMANLIDSPVK